MNIVATNNTLHNHFYKTPLQYLPIETSTNIDTLTKTKYDCGVNSMLNQIVDIETRFHNAPNRTKRYYSKGKKKRILLALREHIIRTEQMASASSTLICV